MIFVEQRTIELSPSLHRWILDNSHQIVCGIEDAYQRRAMVSILEYDETDPAFDRRLRSLSEMPICDHAWSNLPVPPGCRFVPWDRGKVQVYLGTGEVIVCDHHAYVRDSDNRVMCVTPGLFEAPSENLWSGYRLERLKQKAPDLITLLPDKTDRLGIAVLYGADQDIFQQLGYVYTE
jgi:hypothetical protein